LQVQGTDFDIGSRAAPRMYDRNHDGRDDMLVGGIDGKIQLYTSVVQEPVFPTLFIIGSRVLGLRNIREKYYRN
jgi:hypothetical protein